MPKHLSTLRASYTVHHEKTPAEIAHEKVIDEQIAAGWFDVPQPNIPANWRELQAPKKKGGPRRRRRDSENQIGV